MIDFAKKLQEEYLNQENKNKKWHDLFFNKILASGKRFSPFMFNPFNTNNHDLHVRWENIHLRSVIDYFTREDIPFNQKEEFLDDLKEGGILVAYKISEDHNSLLILRNNDTVLDVKKFSSLLSQDSPVYDKLTTSQRKGNCHSGSINIALGSNDNDVLVTGFTHLINSKNNLLHSFIETGSDENKKVIDYTLNAVISAPAYYSLLDVQPITAIDCKDVKQDVSLILNSPYKGIDNRAYLLYRNEMMEQIETLQQNQLNTQPPSPEQ